MNKSFDIKNLLVEDEKILHRASVDDLYVYEKTNPIFPIGYEKLILSTSNINAILTDKRLIFTRSGMGGEVEMLRLDRLNNEAVITSRVGYIISYFYIPLKYIQKVSLNFLHGHRRDFKITSKTTRPYVFAGVFLLILGLLLLAEPRAIALSVVLILASIPLFLYKRKEADTSTIKSTEVYATTLALIIQDEESMENKPMLIIIRSYGDKALEILDMLNRMNRIIGIK
ncbi:MAG: hypothetical protein B6U89_02865 [Desulfurococcales archaeon ex4484_58]|nr:MAG: hypothetical protein B6U89_02865 [Desulfurococcales archaeon ex4484_58]